MFFKCGCNRGHGHNVLSPRSNGLNILQVKTSFRTKRPFGRNVLSDETSCKIKCFTNKTYCRQTSYGTKGPTDQNIPCKSRLWINGTKRPTDKTSYRTKRLSGKKTYSNTGGMAMYFRYWEKKIANYFFMFGVCVKAPFCIPLTLTLFSWNASFYLT